MTIIVAVLLILLLFGTLPTYSYSRTWGYGPSGVVGLLIVVLLVLALLGRIPY
jgi:hypothetical protein